MTSKRQLYFAAAILLAAHSLQASNLFVANTEAGQIVEITPSGTQTIFASGLTDPEDLTFNAAGDLFVSELNINQILEFTPQGVESIFAAGVTTRGLAFDSAGNLYVDTGTEIDKFTAAGVKTTFVFGLPVSDLMGDMPFDALGNLYVVTQDPGEILQITPGGTANVFANEIFDRQSSGLAIDSSGNLYVDTFTGENDQIDKITPGGVVSSFAPYTISGGMAFDSAGVLYFTVGNVVDTLNQGVLGGFATGLDDPQSVAFAPTTVVPEPSSLLLLLPTLGVILLRARRRRTA
jgi:hypothetical protein